MDNTTKAAQWVVPVFITVRAENPAQARMKASQALSYMLDVSNDDGLIRRIDTFDTDVCVQDRGGDTPPAEVTHHGKLGLVMFPGHEVDSARFALQPAQRLSAGSAADALIETFSAYMGSGGNADEQEYEFDRLIAAHGLFPLGATQVDATRAWDEP